MTPVTPKLAVQEEQKLNEQKSLHIPFLFIYVYVYVNFSFHLISPQPTQLLFPLQKFTKPQSGESFWAQPTFLVLIAATFARSSSCDSIIFNGDMRAKNHLGCSIFFPRPTTATAWTTTATTTTIKAHQQQFVKKRQKARRLEEVEHVPLYCVASWRVGKSSKVAARP